MKPSITFFVTDLIEELTFRAVKNEAERRGFETSCSYDLSARAQIGLYCCHVTMIEQVNADFSVIMLHDIGQGQEYWPNFWQIETWERFDLGLLPGPMWQSMYNRTASDPAFHGPLLGAYNSGWPKSDRLYDKSGEFHLEVREARKRLGLSEGKTVLYAPSWENDGKQDDFVNSCLDLGCNLLIKQAAWPDAYPHIVRNIDEMEAKYRGYHPRVHVMDRTADILTALALSDVLVTDESCVMFEALLFNVPSISVSDWLIPDVVPSRHTSAHHDFVIHCTKEQLREQVRAVLDQGRNISGNGKDASYYRGEWYSHLGRSASTCMDLIEWLYESKPYRTAMENINASRRVTELEQEIAAVQARLTDSEESSRALNEKLHECDECLRRANERVREFQTFIDCVHKSRVWRFTRPIRRAIERLEMITGWQR